MLNESILDTYKIDVVVTSLEGISNRKGIDDIGKAYKVAAERGILKTVEIESPFCKDLIIERII